MEPIKPARGIRLSGHLSIPASRALEQIQERFGSRTYDVLSTAVIFYLEAMKNGVGPHAMNMASYQNSPQPKKRTDSHTTQSLSAAKANWCTEYGGSMDGNVCNYDKFEVSLAGTTEVMKRSLDVKDMPDQKEDFKKLILGGYDNIYEARQAAGVALDKPL
jgi:hypothetical protein